MNFIPKFIVQSAQPVKTGGAVGTNQNHACAFIFLAMLLALCLMQSASWGLAT
jgi:hypothetical protein